MIGVKFDQIPEALKRLDNWVLWKTAPRGPGEQPTKLPFQVSGKYASSSESDTWDSFDLIADAYETIPGYDGIGFMFGDDDFVGVDLDGCRDPETGKVTEWARDIVLAFRSYAEISPSGTGIKIFVRGTWGAGRKCNVDFEKISDKTPGVEVYDRGRYFAVTGERLQGPPEPESRQAQLDSFRKAFFPESVATPTVADWRSDEAILARARAYLRSFPPAVSGQGGHNTTFTAACRLVLGFDLPQDDALSLLREWNQSCQPPWSERELLHKVRSADKQIGERGYLANADPRRYDVLDHNHVHTPTPEDLQDLEEVRPRTTLKEAARKHLESVETGGEPLIRLGVPELDSAIGGGVYAGEMVIFAGRPSHGKSAVAMQCSHAFNARGESTLFISEEMPHLLLGKRFVQFFSDRPVEQWRSEIDEVRDSVELEVDGYADCHIVERCGDVETVIEEIENHVRDYNIKLAIVDYAQLLHTKRGGKKQDQSADVSVALRQCGKRLNIVMIVLCQMNRSIETRPKFIPVMSDIKETGQFEQDADCIIFGVWPWKIDSTLPKNEYLFYIAKNRNRETRDHVVTVQFQGNRQRIVAPDVRDMQNYEPAFDNHNNYDTSHDITAGEDTYALFPEKQHE